MAATQNSVVLWKQRYQVMLQELQAKERHWRELEGALRLVATWLILAADHSDEALNHQLENLRVALRSDPKGTTIRGLISEISEGVARIEKYRKRHPAGLDFKSSFMQLLSSLPVPETLLKDRDLLVQRLDGLGSEEDVESLIKRFANLIQDLCDYECAARAPGTPEHPDDRVGHDHSESGAIRAFTIELLEGFLESPRVSHLEAEFKSQLARVHECQDIACVRHSLSRLFEAAAGSSSADGHPEDLANTLLELVERLELPAELDPLIRVLRERLSGGIGPREVKASISDIADLVIRARLAVQREKEDIERFLGGLNRQLAELDHYLASTARSHEEMQERREAFGEGLNADLDEMAQSVDEAASLDDVRSNIRQKLGEIQVRLEADRSVERECGARHGEETERLKKRLKQLEGEAAELRVSVKIERDVARRDALTRLPNRAAYDERIVLEFERWSRYGHPVSIAVLDIDHFKKINDTFGHKTGDRVLKTLGELFAGRVRKVDFAARYGGEEFAVIMPETKASDAWVLIEKLRVEVDACRFRYREEVIPVTLSGGVAEFSRGDTADTVFERADEALYRAKSEGRNRCVVAGMDEPGDQQCAAL